MADATPLKFRCYGREAALAIEPVTAADGVTRTVNIDAARRVEARRYDWADKLVVQVTGRELADVLAALLGLRARVECLHHGPRRDKGYRIEHRPAGLAISVFAAGRGLRRVGLGQGERVALAALLLGQLRRNQAALDDAALVRVLELCYAAPPSAAAAGPPPSPAD